MDSEKSNKLRFLLIEYYDSFDENKWIVKILRASKFHAHITHHRNYSIQALDLKILVEASLFVSYFESMETLSKMLHKIVNQFTREQIVDVKLEPDYDSFEVSDSEIRPIKTKWAEINAFQVKLVDQLRRSDESIDFQNIGNTARHTLVKLSDEVYIDEKHNPRDSKIIINDGAYKNKLHSYIKSELVGTSNDELRKFAIASIDLMEKSIDLANKLTHKDEAQRAYAEVCIIGTIGVIAIIKSVDNNGNK